MSGHKRILALMLAAVLALTAFPFTASATGQDVLEPAPEIALPEPAPEEETQPVTAQEDSLAVTDGADAPVTEYTWWSGDAYLPDLYYSGYSYTDEEEYDNGWYSVPGLEPSEYRRAMKLLTDVEAGKKSLEDLSYPEQPDELKIGVYSLDPGDFNGETYYVMLPSRRLKDNDLLYLISCFRKLGIPFEPKEWNSRNCLRGTYANWATRKLSEEESIRMAALRHLTANGFLTEADIHPETECKSIQTVFGPFCFYPYRRMTDDELAAFALIKDPAWPDAPDEVEKAARKYVADVMKLPLSMKLTETELSRINYSDVIEGYVLTFRIESMDAYGISLQTDGKPQEVSVYLRRRADHSGLAGIMAQVDLYTDYLLTYTSEADDDQKADREKLLGIGKQWFRDNTALDESGFSWRIVKNEWAIPYWVRAENDVWNFTVNVYPDGTVESFVMQSVLSSEDEAALEGLTDTGTQDVPPEDVQAAGTPPVSLEELLEQATQAPPEEPAAGGSSGRMATELYRPSEDPCIPDYYAPDYRNLYQADEGMMYSSSWLEPEELERAKKLLAAVEAGEKTVDDLKYPEYPDEMKVGVYPLDPADFCGETYFVTLPARKLKDYDLLYLISCYKQLGIAFEPEKLNSRNCMRGFCSGGATRNLSAEESGRMETLKNRVIRGMLTDADVHTETECKSIATWFGPFSFYPYRRMTDDELAAFALARDSAWEDHPDAVETAARNFVTGIIELPLAMKLSEAERFRIAYSDVTEGYGMTFRIENADAAGDGSVTDGKPREVYVYLRKRQDNGALRGDSARVSYDFSYSLLFREEGASLSEAELLEIGKQWYKDHLSFDDSAYSFQIMDTGWGSGFWWVDANPADFSWHYYLTIFSDGTIESFNAQKME